MQILVIALIGAIPFLALLLLHHHLITIGFTIGVCFVFLVRWIFFHIPKNYQLFSSIFTSNVFKNMRSSYDFTTLRQNILKNIPSLKDYQIFIFSQKDILFFPEISTPISREDRQNLIIIMQKTLNNPCQIFPEELPLFISQDSSCYASSYSIPFFNKRLMIFSYISTETKWTNKLQEQIISINDFVSVMIYLTEVAGGNHGVLDILKETFWESPYAVGICNPSGNLDLGNDALYQMFRGDVPNFSELIGREVFLLLLDGKKIGQSFSHLGKRIHVEAFPINNKNFLVTKCLFLFVDEQVESKRDLLGETNTLKRFTSGSAVVGAAMFTHDGLILYNNEAFMKRLDVFKVREATQKNIFELFYITDNEYQEIVDQILLGQEQHKTLISKDKQEEFQVLFKGIVFGDKTIIELVLESDIIFHDNMTYLDKETQTLYEELNTARSIQEHILTLPTIYHPGIHVNTLYKPSRQLSGDFFTVIPLPNDQLGILIADVSGHGISASLITAALKILIEFVPTEAGSIPKIMAYFNTYLAGILPEGSFVTLFYGIIDLKENTLQYINSGHPFPLLEDMDRGDVKILEGMGYPLGGLLNVSFDDLVYTIQLPSRSKIILYTDGILQHLSGTMKEKLHEISHFLKQNKAVNDRVLLDKMYGSLVTRNTNIPEDDVSMMLISIDRLCTHKHQLFISSSILEVDNVIEELCSYIQKTSNLDAAAYWKIRTCFYESLLNAVVHGNKYNTQKKVYIEFRLLTDLIVIRIRDEGPGFDFNYVPDPLDENNILKDFGRGIMMIRTLANRIKFNEKGNELTMFFKISKETL